MIDYQDVILQCPNKHKCFTTVGHLDGRYEIDEDLKECAQCGEQMKVVPLKKLTNPDDVLIIADNQLESANYHSLNASNCYDSIISALKEKKINPDKKIKLAIALGLCEYFGAL